MAGVDTGGDVGGLGADGDLDAARVTVEALVGGVVADLEDRLADDVGDRGVGGRAHLTGDHDEAGGQQRLDGDAQVGLVGVLGHQVVEDRVADPVGDLVGVTLGHGLGGEEASSHVALDSSLERLDETYLLDQHPGRVSQPANRRATSSQMTWASAVLDPRGTSTARSVGGQDDRLVVGAAEDRSPADVVDDEEVAALAGQLGAPEVEHRAGGVAGLGGEARR